MDLAARSTAQACGGDLQLRETPMKRLSIVLEFMLFLVLVAVLLMGAAIFLNSVPLTGAPGFATRTWTYITEHQAESRPDSPFLELQPPTYEMPPGRLFKATLEAVKGLRWEVTAQNRASRRIQAVATTPILRQKSDISIQVQTLAGGKSAVYIRSVSRRQLGDLGTNSGNILKLYRTIDIMLPLLP